MKQNLLDILACPDCQLPLELALLKEGAVPAGEILEAALLCKNCALTYFVIDGIPRFVPNILESYPEFCSRYPKIVELSKGKNTQLKNFKKLHASTQERFGFEWMNYPGALSEDREIFLAETQIPETEWKGKKVLDAGCGMGRYSRVAHEFGATVVSLDLSGALIRLQDVALSSNRAHLIQGNLMSPPLREKSFDIVFSIGVIHHTPSAKKTFQKLAKLVRPDGQLSVWVYGTAGQYKNFKTNPLRSDRQGLKKYLFLVWLIVIIREIISNTLRFFTTHMPHQLISLLCYPLSLAGKIPLFQYLTFSVHPLWRVRLQENFDWLAPPYQSHHTKEELMNWFEENGFEIEKRLPHGFVPKPGVLGRKKA